MKNIVVITESILGPEQLTGFSASLFYKVYNFFYSLQLQLLIQIKVKSSKTITVVTSRNLLGERRVKENIEVQFYDDLIFNVDYLKGRKEAWDFAENWYKTSKPSSLGKKFTYEGINLNSFISLRHAIFLNQSILSYYQAIEEIFKKEKPQEIYLFSGLSSQEKIAMHLARKYKIPFKVYFKFSLVPVDALIKKFLRKREMGILRNKLLDMGNSNIKIPPRSIVATASHTSHLKSIIPLARKLKNKYPTVVVGDFLSMQNDLKTLKADDYGWTYFSAFIGQEEIEKKLNKFKKYFKQVQEEIEKEIVFEKPSKKGLIFSLASDYLKNRITEVFPLTIIYLIAIERFFKKTKPKMVVFISDRGILEKSFSIMAKKYSTPTILYSPNNVMSVDMTNRYDIADLVLITGRHMLEELHKIGYQKDKIKIVGDLRFDNIRSLIKILKREELLRKVGIKKRKKIVLLISLYSSDYSPVYEKMRYFKAVSVAVESIPNTELLIRPHPNESLILLGEQLKRWNITNAKVVHELNIYEILYLADLVIMLHSMIGFEAQVFGKPVISVNLLKKNYQRYVPYGGSILEITDEDKLRHAIVELLDEKSTARKNLIIKGERFSKKYLGEVDGKVAERVKSYILRMTAK